jgi:hypothetical protein
MSRGLGVLQREIKAVLDRSFDLGTGALPFSALRTEFVINAGGRPEQGNTLSEARERSLKRALKGLVDRGDVITHGAVRPRSYVTVEKMASFFCDEVKNTAHAKQVLANANAEAEAALAKLRSKRSDEDPDHPR